MPINGTVLEARSAARKVGYRDELGLSGHMILDQARDRYFKRWVHFPNQQAADFHTLWAQHTHFKVQGELIWNATPRAYYLGRSGSGKSTALETLNLTCDNTYGLDLDPTQYGLQYALGQDHATVLLDEGDVSAIPDTVIAIINAGYTPNGKVLNGRGQKATRVPVFGPLAMAAIDDIKTGKRAEKIDVMLSRGIQVHMEPGPHDRWTREAVRKGEVVRKAFAWWAQIAMKNGLNMEPDMPDYLDYREAQILEPLYTIAEAAGGDWPERVENLTETAIDFAEEFKEL